ncbi:TPA: class I SAM-dependent methyltransferase [Candidatus Micrarchaeota archaeon]|nr:class I SAM-dependent methyltransferase [Candidatus Micrarchaeota archaeon]
MERAHKCRICKEDTVKEFIDYGKQPLGNVVINTQTPKNEYIEDMKLGVCTKCWLVQQINFPSYDRMQEMYDSFAYVPYGAITRDNLTNLGLSILKAFGPRFVLDIGSNDGTLLKPLIGKCKVLGIEPAEEIAKIAQDNGIDTLVGYFTDATAKEVTDRHGNPDIITMTQVLQHIPDLEGFVKNIEAILAGNGTLIIEGRYFTETLRQNSYDTAYLETVWLFTLTSLMGVLERHGLYVFRAEKTDVYGGSLRIFASKGRRKDGGQSGHSVADILAEELDMGIKSLTAYQNFGDRSLELRDKFNALINALHGEGKLIAAYGASATSTTMLNFCGLDSKTIKYIVDESRLKQGRFTSGTHIPIVGLDHLDKNRPDYMIITAWRLYPDIVGKIPKGVKIILPLPEVKVL